MTSDKEALRRIRASRVRAQKAYRERRKAEGYRSRTYILAPHIIEMIATASKVLDQPAEKVVEAAVEAFVLTKPLQDKGNRGKKQTSWAIVREGAQHVAKPWPATPEGEQIAADLEKSRRERARAASSPSRPITPPKPPKGSGKRPEGTEGYSVQVGPVKAEPGSRLKGGKK